MTNRPDRIAPGNLSSAIGHWSLVIFQEFADLAETLSSLYSPPLRRLTSFAIYSLRCDVNQTGQRDAVAETTLHATFRFEKVDGKWVIREVRLGKRPWERLDDILRALEQVKTEQTRKLLEQVAAAIEKYREANGALPDFKDYVSLSDTLSPKYMNPLIREDAWHNPLAASRSAPGTVRLLSAGPDGRTGTPDDI